MIRFSLERSGRLGGESLRVLKISARMRARIWESTPRSSRVSLRTSFSSLMLAIQFKLSQTQQKLLMQAQPYMISPNLTTRTPRSPLSPLSPPASPSAHSPLLAALGEGVGVSTGLVVPGINQLRRISSRVQLKNKRGVLHETEQRIFSEVIDLLQQIDDLRNNIISTSHQIQEWQVSHPDIHELVQFHGYTQRLTNQQCSDLQQENLQLVRQIQQIQSAQANSLQEVLRIERQKNEELKQELNESKSSNPTNLDGKINTLKNAIAELEHSRRNQVDAHFPEFEQLRLKNEELRQKTISNLRSGSSSQLQYLRSQLARDEEERLAFMQDLKKFKEEYSRRKKENQALKQRLGRVPLEAKENSNTQARASKAASSRSLQLQISKRRGNDKLKQYESHIRMMQNLKA